MIIGFISDLHIENRTFEIDEYIEALMHVMAKRSIKQLMIGGDISNHYSVTLKFVEQLQAKSQIPVYFIPGNHDLWDRYTPQEDINTMEIYDIYRAHPQSLIEKPLLLNENTGIVGHTAWYNYIKYNRNRFNERQIEAGKFKGIKWQDKKFIRWPYSDKEMSQIFAQQVQKDIEQLNAQKLILVTHMVTRPEFTMPLPHRVFDFFNAYIATNDFRHIYDNYPIAHSFMGHVHFRHQVEEDGIKYYANSLGYVKEWRTKNLIDEIDHAMVTIEI